MNKFIVLAIIVIWLLYGIVIKLTKKRKYDYTMFIAFVFLLAYGYFYFYNDYQSFEYDLYSYITPSVFVLWILIDNTMLLFKKNVSEFDFYALEEELEHVSTASELLRQRFISTIEILNDGICFRDGKTMFGTDKYIEIMGLEHNEFTLDDYEKLVFKDDIPQYNMKLEKLSKKYPTYSIKYRIKKGSKTTWVFEKGKVIFINKKRSYISIVKTIDIKMYPETDVDVLNTMSDGKKLHEEMQRLTRHKKPYHLILILLTNIPEINEKYGRDFGDLMMGEYLSKTRFKFIKDNKSLFRISGIKFALLIKDRSKYDLLDRALVGTGELLNLRMKFGGNTQTIYPNFGISESPYEGKIPEKVYQEAEEALRISLSDDIGVSYQFYNQK